MLTRSLWFALGQFIRKLLADENSLTLLKLVFSSKQSFTTKCINEKAITDFFKPVVSEVAVIYLLGNMRFFVGEVVQNQK